jgi:hypothetical protein
MKTLLAKSGRVLLITKCLIIHRLHGEFNNLLRHLRADKLPGLVSLLETRILTEALQGDKKSLQQEV